MRPISFWTQVRPDLQYKQVLSEKEYREEVEKWGYGPFRVGMGAEAVQEL